MRVHSWPVQSHHTVDGIVQCTGHKDATEMAEEVVQICGQRRGGERGGREMEATSLLVSLPDPPP